MYSENSEDGTSNWYISSKKYDLFLHLQPIFINTLIKHSAYLFIYLLILYTFYLGYLLQAIHDWMRLCLVPLKYIAKPRTYKNHTSKYFINVFQTNQNYIRLVTVVFECL
jgi:hypothetical protein